MSPNHVTGGFGVSALTSHRFTRGESMLWGLRQLAGSSGQIADPIVDGLGLGLVDVVLDKLVGWMTG